MELIKNDVTVYNFDVGGNGTYIADGIVVHNKDQEYTVYPCPTCWWN
jgi:hypothetical protein